MSAMAESTIALLLQDPAVAAILERQREAQLKTAADAVKHKRFESNANKRIARQLLRDTLKE